MSPEAASAIHRPEALIHRTPSRLIEIFPVLACVSKGSLPTRRARSSKGHNSASRIPPFRSHDAHLRVHPENLLQRFGAGSISKRPIQ